jgi:hypothetical protein
VAIVPAAPSVGKSADIKVTKDLQGRLKNTQQIDETGNVLSTIKSQGFRDKRASAPDFLKLIQILREMTSGLE